MPACRRRQWQHVSGSSRSTEEQGDDRGASDLEAPDVNSPEDSDADFLASDEEAEPSVPGMLFWYLNSNPSTVSILVVVHPPILASMC